MSLLLKYHKYICQVSNYNNMKFLIEELHLDPMENLSGNALVYEIKGYKNKKEDAEKYCEKGKKYTHVDCWAIQEGKSVPQYRLQEIEEL